MERQGFEIQRIALRGWKESLPDAEDRQEQEKTQYVLRTGLRGILLPWLLGLLRSPLKMYAAFRLAIRVSRQTDGRLLHHLVCVAEASRILNWIVRSRTRHLHAHFGTNSAEIAMQIHVQGKPPFSFTVHGPDEFLAPLGLEDKISRAAFVVAISSFGAKPALPAHRSRPMAQNPRRSLRALRRVFIQELRVLEYPILAWFASVDYVRPRGNCCSLMLSRGSNSAEFP